VRCKHFLTNSPFEVGFIFFSQQVNSAANCPQCRGIISGLFSEDSAVAQALSLKLPPFFSPHNFVLFFVL
jgi:hypothetical protein